MCQDFLKAIKSLKYEDADAFMNDWINRLKESSLKEFNNLAGMFENWKKEIINSFIQFGERRLHNGYIEGVINHIKEIKRISYCYRNFHHLRARIMCIFNDDVPLSKVDTTIIKRKKRNNK